MPNPLDDVKARRGLPEKAFAKADDQIRVRTDRYHQLYANNFRLNLNAWDIGITFGEITGEKEGRSVIEETVKVSMTREMAKILSIILQNHVEGFEAEFGEIRIPVAPDEVVSDTEPEPQSDPIA